MITEKFYKRPIIMGITVAAIIHSAAVLIRELSPIPSISPIIDTIAFNGSWVYILSMFLFMAINSKQVKQFFICLPDRVSSKTVEGLKVVLGYESVLLFILLVSFPAITYFYSMVHEYFNKENPELHRFLDYMPFTDLINRAMTSFPFFVTLFALVSLLCVIMPHTYFSYKCAKKSAAPLSSAIVFSIILSLIITIIVLGLLALSVSPLILPILFLVGPFIFFSYIAINIMTLRQHDKYIQCP